MERWAAMVPSVVVKGGVKIQLLGKLPIESYIIIFQFLPIPDISSLALCCRKLSVLSRDDKIWKRKLDWLDYKGPGRMEYNNSTTSSDEGYADNVTSPHSSKAPLFPIKKNEVNVDDEFGDFFDGDEELARIEDDDGFGEFQDFDEVVPIKATSTATGGATNDLMMMFDDIPIANTSRKPPAPPPIIKKSRPLSTASKPSARNAANGNTPQLSFLEVFKQHQVLLLPYYISLITHTTSSLIFTSPTLTPSTRSQLLSSLVRFCSPLLAPSRSLPQRTTVLRNVQSSMDFFESALLAEFEKADTRGDESSMREKARLLWDLNASTSVVQVFVQKREIFYDQSHDPLKNLVKMESPSGDYVDGIDFSVMDAYLNKLLYVVTREGGIIARVFPPEADFLLYFTERIANEVISDYITTLLSAAQPLTPPLFLLATAATFGQVYRLVDTVLNIEPKNSLVTKERVEDVVFKMFEPLMDDYLQEEADWIREVLEGVCAEWDQKTASALALSDPTFLASSNPAQAKRNILAGFTKVLLLPVTIIPKTAVYGLNAITSGATGTFNALSFIGTGIGNQFSSGANSRLRTLNGSKLESNPGSEKSNSITDLSDTLDQASITSLAATSTTSLSSVVSGGPSTPKRHRFDRLQLLLSLDTALQLIQADRDVLKRIQTFVRYPGLYGRKVRDAIEEVFIILLQTLGEKHVGPAFSKATLEMEKYKAEEYEEGTQVAPLVQFFELVHIGDTIQQMLEVYFDKEMAGYIDKKDFLNAVIREKKRFEILLDDAVAQGLNAGVNILMNQVEHIIYNHQGLRDFSPPEGIDLDLYPTKTCREAIDVLVTHCDMLKGNTDKQILEVFHQEVGIRLFGIILKHLKKQIISINGGFQLISDLNAYYNFIVNLKQPTITTYFTSLKLLGEIFIIDEPKDLGQLVRDVSRYEGTISADDLYECVQRRADWKRIEKQVEGQLFGLRVAEDCIIC